MIAPWIQRTFDDLTQSYPINRLPSAIIIDARPGWGSTELAALWVRHLIKTENDPRVVPHPDYMWEQPTEPDGSIEPSSKRPVNPNRIRSLKIEQIRKSIDYMYLSRQVADRKVTVLEGVESMTISASHALLKTLEEPLGDCHWVLLTHAFDVLLPTIRSRCQRVPLGTAPEDEVQEWLIEQGIPVATLENLLYEYGNAPYAILQDWSADMTSLREVLAEVWKSKTLDLSTALKLKDYAFDELLIRWMRITQRLLHTRYYKRAFHFWDELIATRRAFHDSPNLNRQLHIERLLVHWNRITWR